jgi:cystathionine beta-synthase
MNYKNNILETVGHTPLIKLNRINKGLSPLILVKMESFNPGGSSKDRIAIAMINEAERKGLLQPGGTIIEPTSGNTGLGLALMAILRGYRVIFTIPDKTSKEKEDILKAHGATVIRTPGEADADDPRSSHKIVERLLRKIPNSFSPNQYLNENNPEAHYRSTGPEIWEDTARRISHFVAGMGTGGTISGTGKFLKEKNPDIQVIGVDTEGSLYEDYFKNRETKAHGYLTEGIGKNFIPPIVSFEVIDDIVTVSDKEAFATARALVREEGIFSGSSAGAAVFAGLQVARKLSPEDVMVILLPDSGKSYLSTLYNDDWMRAKGLLHEKEELQIEMV